MEKNPLWNAARRTELLIGAFGALCFFGLALCVPQANAQEGQLPKLGSQVPAYVLKARTHSRQCLTDIDHHDACASVRIRKTLFTIAWDENTKAISYLFTDDHSLVTDGELGVGGSCSLVDEEGKPDEVVRYMDWLVTPKWTDTAGYLSGDAVWYAAIHRDAADPQNGTVVGFVQSRYLRLSK